MYNWLIIVTKSTVSPMVSVPAATPRTHTTKPNTRPSHTTVPCARNSGVGCWNGSWGAGG
eukprot:363944-Chlamydomonas_euryale.AAC.4